MIFRVTLRRTSAAVVIAATSLVLTMGAWGQGLGAQGPGGQGLGGPEDYAYDGFMEPVEDVMVSAVELGRLDSVLVKVGDRVVAGQELATLENSLQIISLEIAHQQTLMKGELNAALAEHSLHASRTEQLRILAAMASLSRSEVWPRTSNTGRPRARRPNIGHRLGTSALAPAARIGTAMSGS